jgi:pimeloyl-ACP methyl ester carboxylesterase
MKERMLGVRMDKQIIFEDDHIRAIYLAGESDTLVLSFGDLITRAKGLSINAEKSLMKYNYAVVGIMPKQKSWFPASSMAALLQHLQPILSQFKNIVGYGGSMGGYAAIKYAKDLNMNRVVAMVPQYSIDPSEVEDKRYTDFYDADLNANMRIQAQDIV